MATHDTSKSTKNVTYSGEIKQSVPADFRSRILKIQAEGGMTQSAHSTSVGDKITKAGMLNVYNNVVNTRNGIASLKDVTLVSYPSSLHSATGAKIDTESTPLVATIERNIGRLENYCVAFERSCSANKSSNKGSYVAANSTKRTSFDGSKFTHNNATHCTHNHSANFSTHNTSYKSSHFAHHYRHFHGPGFGHSVKFVHFYANKANNTPTFTKSANKVGNFAFNKSSNHTGNSGNFAGNEATCPSDFVSNFNGNFATDFSKHSSTCMIVHTVFTVGGVNG